MDFITCVRPHSRLTSSNVFRQQGDHSFTINSAIGRWSPRDQEGQNYPLVEGRALFTNGCGRPGPVALVGRARLLLAVERAPAWPRAARSLSYAPLYLVFVILHTKQTEGVDMT